MVVGTINMLAVGINEAAAATGGKNGRRACTRTRDTGWSFQPDAWPLHIILTYTYC